MNKKINIKQISLIITISIVLGIIYNTFSVDGIPFIREPLKVEMVNLITEDGKPKNLRGIDLETTLQVFNKNNALFIDARDQWEFSEGHILGAINIPEFSFNSENELLKTINKDQLIIVYCDGDDCDTSKRLANELTKLGYSKCYVFLGGFSVWNAAILPTERDSLK